jgi:hypothetical protein
MCQTKIIFLILGNSHSTRNPYFHIQYTHTEQNLENKLNIIATTIIVLV